MDKMKNYLKHKKDELQQISRQTTLRQLTSNDRNATNVELGKDADDEFIEDVCSALHDNTNVNRLQVKNYDLSSNDALVGSLAAVCSTTKTLSTLRIVNCGLTDESSMPLFGALANNTSIRGISLEGNALRSSDGVSLLLQHHKTLEDLDIGNNALDEEGLFGIAAALPCCESIRSLSLAGNNISDHVVMKFATTLEKHLQDVPHLHTLEFGKEASIRPETKKYLLSMFEGRPKPSKLAALTQGLRSSNDEGLQSPSKERFDPPSHQSSDDVGAVAGAESPTTEFVGDDMSPRPEASGRQSPVPMGDVDKVKTLEAEIERLKQANKALEMTVAAKTSEMSMLKNSVDRTAGGAEKEQTMRTAAETKLKEAEAALDLQKELAQDAATARLKMEMELDQLRECVKEIHREHAKELDATAEHVEELRAQLDDAARRLASMAEQRDNKAAEAVALESSLRAKTVKVAQLQASLTKLTMSQLEEVSAPPSASDAETKVARPTQDSSTMTELRLLDWDRRKERRESRKDQIRFQRALRGKRSASGITPMKRHSSARSVPMKVRQDTDGGSFVAVDEEDVDLDYTPMTKNQWEDDDAVENCGHCNRRFGLTTWKHHCRRCGRVFCDNCCPKSKLHDDTRICTSCVNAASTKSRSDSVLSSGRARVNDM